MITIVLFFISLSVIVLLFVIKAVEEARGREFFSYTRAELDHKVIRVMDRIEEMHLEAQFEQILKDLIRRIEHDAAVVLLFLVRLVERRLVVIIAAIRGQRRIEKKESSEYVKTIVEHKNELKGKE
jgi:hypothetical protein